jgi:hypothetical protein
MKIKNVDNTLENIDTTILKSLSLLDDSNVYISIVFILFLYNTCIFKNINNLVSEYYEYPTIRVIVLLLIIYIARKSCLIAILLAISFIISLNYKSIMENFEPLSGNNQENQENQEDEVKESFKSKIPPIPAIPAIPNNVKERFNNKEEQLLDTCINNFPQKNEKVGESLCDSVSTFENSYTTQGLDILSGFDKNQSGYSLDEN